MHSLQLCVFATVKWVEIILYSVKNKQTEESVILHFQEYNELFFPNFEVCTLPKIISVLIEVLWVFFINIKLPPAAFSIRRQFF